MSFGPLMSTLGVRRRTLSVMYGFLGLRFSGLYVVQQWAICGEYTSGTWGVLLRSSFWAFWALGLLEVGPWIIRPDMARVKWSFTHWKIKYRLELRF